MEGGNGRFVYCMMFLDCTGGLIVGGRKVDIPLAGILRLTLSFLSSLLLPTICCGKRPC